VRAQVLAIQTYRQECKSIGLRNSLAIRAFYRFGTFETALRLEQTMKVFENRALKRIFGLKRDEIVGDWRNLHNGEFNKFHFSSSIIQMIKSKRMR
jgi:hypothetical protein